MESGSCISTATFIQIITKSPSPQFAGWGMILSVPIPIPTDKNGTFMKTLSGGRSQHSSGSPRYSNITATCRGEKYWQPTRYPCFFNSSHKGMQRLIQSIRWRRAVALLVASGKKSKPNSVLLYIRFDISIIYILICVLQRVIYARGFFMHDDPLKSHPMPWLYRHPH